MENLNYRNCNEELAIKIIGKLTLEMPELEVNLPKQLEVKRFKRNKKKSIQKLYRK